MPTENQEPDDALDDIITFIEDKIAHRELNPYEIDAIEGKILYWWSVALKQGREEG